MGEGKEGRREGGERRQEREGGKEGRERVGGGRRRGGRSGDGGEVQGNRPGYLDQGRTPEVE